MVFDSINYVRRNVLKAKEENISVEINVLKSCLVFQHLYKKHYDEVLSIDKIIEIVGDDIGLIGPGKGILTWLLEKIFNDSKVVRTHAILHDAYGRFYNVYKKDRGYVYCIREEKTFNWMKKSMFCGQISGLIYCKYIRDNL